MNSEQDILSLLSRYDQPIPRYTSYPTVPYWNKEQPDADVWLSHLRSAFLEEHGEISLYIHLPFCENLCTFCACNKRITKNHGVEEGYIRALLAEWAMYRKELPGSPRIREIHLGGGTPTFFSPGKLKTLLEGILENSEVTPEHEFSVEVHPNFTTRKHLEVLSSLGFNRISLGVQDFDPEVQYVINRLQTYGKTKEVVDWSRELGYESLNIDLVYGLPRQSVNSILHTTELLKSLSPGRIAYYSYAHVPWKSKGQRRYTEADLPSAESKWEMYQTGRKALMDQGFLAIGMDHFALPGDKLFTAWKRGELHRNFMGYTTTNNRIIIGLGASSIGDCWTAFIQNEKEVEAYQERVLKGEWPFMAGHILNEEDILLRGKILDLMCRSRTDFPGALSEMEFIADARARLEKFREDGLLSLENNEIVVSAAGEMFIRNICSALDSRLWRTRAGDRLFSRSI